MWFPGIDPPEDPHADEIAALMDERDHMWRLLCEAEDAGDTDEIEAYRVRLDAIDREVDYISSGERESDWLDESLERMWDL